MKTTVLIAVLLTVAAGQVWSAEEQGTAGRGNAKGIDQKKAEIVRHIEDRIANSKLELVCVQGAASHDALKACREKYRPQHRQ